MEARYGDGEKDLFHALSILRKSAFSEAKGLLLREKGRYCYRLTENGNKTAVLFLLVGKRIFGALSGSVFSYKPQGAPVSKLERAFDKAENSINELLQTLQAA